jgi:cytochrome c biogenesis protein ResB
LTSVKTGLALLGTLAFLFFLGMLFPQGSMPYALGGFREARGELVRVADALGVFSIVDAWYFRFVTMFFLLHLVLCLIDRLGVLRTRLSFRLFTREELLRRDHSLSLECRRTVSDLDIENVLENAGFRRVKYYSEDSQSKRIVCEKGIPFRWLSWGYHLFILLAVGGFFLTRHFAFDEAMTLAVGERKAVELHRGPKSLRHFASLFRPSSPTVPRRIEIALEGFSAEYAQTPVLQYPDRPIDRLLAAWGLRDEPIRYALDTRSLRPRIFRSRLRLFENGSSVLEDSVATNDPIDWQGLTLYQSGAGYSFELAVDDGVVTGIHAEEPFTIPQMEGEFRMVNPRAGTVVRYDGVAERVTPAARLQHRPPRGQGTGHWVTLAELTLGRPADVMHTGMTLIGFKEGSILRCRYDAGSSLLCLAAIVSILLMVGRIYLPWYQLRCHADGSRGWTLVTISVRMVGLLARPERLKQRLSEALLK